MDNTFMDKYLTPIAVIVGAAVIALALIFGHGGTKQAGTDGAQKPVDIKNVKTEGEPFVGNANAPVTFAVFYDYQCPFCKQFDQTVLAQVYEKYVKTGKVKIVFKDFQFLGQDSLDGAEFGRAVWEAYPDHFYEWYVAMFAAQDDEGDQGFGDMESIKKLTAEKVPAIDVATITKLIASKKAQYDTAITASRSEGAALGINGTPSAILGKQIVTGQNLYSVEAVSALIDAELKK